MRVESCKLIIIFALVFSTSVFAQSFSFEGGWNYFVGSLQKDVKNAPYFGVGFALGLSDYTSGYLQGSYSYLHLKNNSDFKGLHQFLGRAGIEVYELLGVGISLAGVRGNSATPQAENYMLASSESEFGWDFHLKFNLFKLKSWAFGAKLNYDIIWTSPKNSHILQAGIFAGY